MMKEEDGMSKESIVHVFFGFGVLGNNSVSLPDKQWAPSAHLAKMSLFC